MRIFLDANILFSAAKSDGAERGLVRALLDAGHLCCVDRFVIEEARRNLIAKSDAEAHVAFASLLERMQLGASVANARVPQAALILPEKDRPVMAAAIANACERLVTGDRTHFGLLYGKTIAGVKVCTPAALAQELL